MRSQRGKLGRREGFGPHAGIDAGELEGFRAGDGACGIAQGLAALGEGRGHELLEAPLVLRPRAAGPSGTMRTTLESTLGGGVKAPGGTWSIECISKR